MIKPNQASESNLVKPKIGEMFLCDICKMEIQIAAECGCDDNCALFMCCGQPMVNVTEPTVQASEVVGDGDQPVGEIS